MTLVLTESAASANAVYCRLPSEAASYGATMKYISGIRYSSNTPERERERERERQTDRQTETDGDRDCDFLLTFYSNYGSMSCRFLDIQRRKMS